MLVSHNSAAQEALMKLFLAYLVHVMTPGWSLSSSCPPPVFFPTCSFPFGFLGAVEAMCDEMPPWCQSNV